MNEGQEAFEERVGRVLDDLYDGARLLTADDTRAQALVVSVCVEAARRYPAGLGSGSFRNWMLGRFVRHYMHYLSQSPTEDPEVLSRETPDELSQQSPRAVPDESGVEALLAGLESLDEEAPGELARLIRSSVRNLPLQERIALWLVNIRSLTYQEAANALDIGVAELRRYLYRARRRLQIQLGVALQGATESPLTRERSGEQ